MRGFSFSSSSFDIRVHLLLLLISNYIFLFTKENNLFMIALAAALFFLLLQGRLLTVVKFLIIYFCLSALQIKIAGISGLQTIWIFVNIGRRLLLPIAFLQGLSECSTGEVLSVFAKIHFPKVIGISILVLMRYIPAIRYEIKSIRTALKYRGVGVRRLDFILHFYTNFKYTLIPMLMRTLAITDELSAAAMVRGVKLNNKITSYDKITFKKKDWLVAILISGIFAGIIVIEKMLY